LFFAVVAIAAALRVPLAELAGLPAEPGPDMRCQQTRVCALKQLHDRRQISTCGLILEPSVPQIVINRDGPEDRLVAFIVDHGGKMELSTQQLRNPITLLVSDEFWAITGL
jgi:hypothetical protein